MEKTKSLGRLWLTIMLGMVVLLMGIGVVSAVELNPFADSKSFTKDVSQVTSTFLKEDFNSKYGVISLSSNFLWIPTGQKAEYSLIETKESIIDLSMEGKATLYEDGTLFDSATFIGGDVREGKYYIEITKDNYVDVPDTYKKQCDVVKGNALNGTADSETCYDVPATYKSINQPIIYWEEYNKDRLRAGDYKWKFEGKRNIGDKIDIIPIKDSKEFSEWVWFNSSWGYRKQINITGGTASISNFTIFINVTYNTNMNLNYSDIRFTSSDGTTEYSYELLNNYTNSSQFFVRLDTMTTGINSIYMYYGNAIVATSSSPTNTFKDYFAIFHFENMTTGLGYESLSGTTYAIVGSPTKVISKFGNGMNASTNGQWINLGNYQLFTGLSTATVLSEIRLEKLNNLNRVFRIRESSGNDQIGLMGGTPGNYAGKMAFRISTNNTNTVDTVASYIDVINAERFYGGRFNGTGSDLFDNQTQTITATKGILRSGTFDSRIGDGYDANQGLNGIISELWFSNKSLSNEYILRWNLMYDQSLITFGAEETEPSTVLSLLVTLISPANGYNTTQTSIGFSSNATATNGNLTNATLYMYNGTTYTSTTTITGTSNSTNISRTGMADGNYNWSVRYCATNSSSTLCYMPANRTFTIDTTAPAITITYPLSASYTDNVTAMNYTITDVGTLSACWYSLDSGVTNTSITCGNNITGLNSTQGFNRWTVYSNDSLNNVGSTSVTFTGYTITESVSLDSTAIEGELTNFYLNVTTFNISSISSNLTYAGTNYPMTLVNNNGSLAQFNVTITPPTVSVNTVETVNFTYDLNNGLYVHMVNYTQINQVFLWTLCNATYTVPYLNMTFKNETVGQEDIKARISTTFHYYLNNPSITKSYTFSTTGENSSWSFCGTPSNYVFNVTSLDVLYSNAGSPQREWAINSLTTFSNNTYNKTLYLLPSSLGQYVTFQIVSGSFQAIPGALVNITQATFGNVGSSVSDAAGGTTFFLNPTLPYTIQVSKTGYSSATEIIVPSSASYTIVLGGSSVSNITDTSRGITFLFGPTDTSLSNGTTYTFNYTISSTYWTLDNWGYILRNSSTTLATQSSVANGGTLSSNVNTGTSQNIYMNYYWIVNGTTSNGTRSWLVLDTSGTSYSIANFFVDLKAYLLPASGIGIFGLTAFGLSIIIYLVIFISTGFVSYKFGFTSPAIVVGIGWLLLFFFDVVMGLVQNPVNAVPHSPTVILFIILIGFILKEGVE